MTLNLLHFYSVCQNYTSKNPCATSVDGYIDDSLILSNPDDANGPNLLDNTGGSEGMLEDIDKDDLIKRVLSVSSPNLMAVLKGNLDQISAEHLEKEVQELNISLQAAAGMMKISLMPKQRQQIDENFIQEDDKQTTVPENDTFVSELSQHPLSVLLDSSNELVCRDATVHDHIEVNTPRHVVGESMQSYTSLDTGISDASVPSADFTTLKFNQELSIEEKFTLVLTVLNEASKKRDMLQLKLHQTIGMLTGLKDVKTQLEKQNEHLEENLAKVNAELEVSN